MKILDFNNGRLESEGLLNEFRFSGIEIIDTLWSKSAETFEERASIADDLFEVAVNGADNQARIAVQKLLNKMLDGWISVQELLLALPLFDHMPQILYRKRTFYGNGSDWADMVYALIIRQPLANHYYRSQNFGNARSVINECLERLLFSTHVLGLNYHSYLVSRMEDMIGVALWFSRNDLGASRDVSLFTIPIQNYLFDRKDKGITGTRRDRVMQLYEQLDCVLQIVDEKNGVWSGLHQRCLEVLGEPKERSRLFQISNDVPKLIVAFKMRLSEKTGTELADLLLSSDGTRLWRYVEGLSAAQRAETFLGLSEARKMYVGNVGLRTENGFEILHKALHEFAAWREFYNVAVWLNDQEMNVSDRQLATMVDLLATSGSVAGDATINRAFKHAATGGYPQTLRTLRDFASSNEIHSSVDFVRYSKMIKTRLKRLSNK